MRHYLRLVVCLVGLLSVLSGCTRTGVDTKLPAVEPKKKAFNDPVFMTIAEKMQFGRIVHMCDVGRFDEADAMVQMRQNLGEFERAVKLLERYKEVCGDVFQQEYNMLINQALARNKLLSASPQARKFAKNIRLPTFEGRKKQMKILFKHPNVKKLHNAIEKGDLQKASHILSVGGRLFIDLEYAPNTKTALSPLSLAIRQRNLPMIKLLVEKGAELTGRPGNRAITMGAMVRDDAVFSFLLSRITSRQLADMAQHYQYSPMIFAAGQGSLKAIERLIAKGEDPAFRSKDGYSVLSILPVVAPEKVPQSQYETELLRLVSMVVKGGGNPNDRLGKQKLAILHRAVKNGASRLVSLLSELKADFEIRDIAGKTPLFYAMESQNNEIFDLLVKGGADINAADNDGQTLLMHAVYQGKKDIVDRLLQAGANVNARNQTGATALAFVAKKAQVDVARMLLQAGADVNVTDKDGDRPATRILCAYQVQKKKKQPDLIRLLAKYGADLSYTGGYWGSALHCVTETGDPAALQALKNWQVKNQAPPFDVNAVNHKGETPLFQPAYEGHLMMVLQLIKKGANVNHRNKYGRTALFSAVWNDQAEIIKRLIQKGADINAADKNGKTPLMSANRKKTIQRLLLHRADIHRTDKSGRTALWWMSKGNYSTAVKELLKHGADANQADIDGVTPLMVGSLYLSVSIPEALLAHGADPTRKDRQGSSPMLWSIYDPDHYPLLKKVHQTLQKGFLKFKPQCSRFARAGESEFKNMSPAAINYNFKNCLGALPPDRQVTFLETALVNAAKDSNTCLQYARYLEKFSIPEHLKNQDRFGENDSFWEKAGLEATKAASQCLGRPFDQFSQSHNCPIKGMEKATRLFSDDLPEGTVQCLGIIPPDKKEATNSCPGLALISRSKDAAAVRVRNVALPHSKLSDPEWCQNYHSVSVKHGVDQTVIRFFIERARPNSKRQGTLLIHEVYNWNNGNPEKTLDQTTDWQFRFSM